MNYKIEATIDFEKQLKSLAKKYRSLSSDLKKFEADLLANPTMGDDLGNNTRKVRMAIASKGKGKSGGARVITCNVLLNITNTKIYLLTICDKSEQSSIAKSEIEHLKKINGLSAL
jgi:mRNA-degrading endonuclease RelE of RelBE toxin-antitoxin system